MGLEGVFRSTAKKLVEGLGVDETVVLRTATSGDYDTLTGTVDRTETDRAIQAVRTKDERGEAGSRFRRTLTFLVAAQGLYVDGLFRLPDQGDRVLVGADEVFGDDDNPGWDGGKEYEVLSFDATTVGGSDVLYEMVVGR